VDALFMSGLSMAAKQQIVISPITACLLLKSNAERMVVIQITIDARRVEMNTTMIDSPMQCLLRYIGTKSDHHRRSINSCQS